MSSTECAGRAIPTPRSPAAWAGIAAPSAANANIEGRYDPGNAQTWAHKDRRTKLLVALSFVLGRAVFGLSMGGGVRVAPLTCHPGGFIVLGVAVLQGYILWA